MPKIGDPPQPIPGITGTSWFAVEHISNFPFSWTHSHAHPEPNRVAAALENKFLKFSNESKLSVIEFKRFPDGVPPQLGPIISQNKQ